ncbi:hypothetical protein, partial [Ilumatobacter sp.]|uniref:hypothetical protein n=1 Tax=Ilumatobacter sp. TaxID=1967498 RepID=UPI003AF82F73
TDEPTTDEPTTDEPTTDEPTTDEPTTDEPTTEEPTTEEPTTRLVVTPDFTWTPEKLPAQVASFSVIVGGSDRTVELDLKPQVDLRVSYTPTSGEVRTVLIDPSTATTASTSVVTAPTASEDEIKSTDTSAPTTDASPTTTDASPTSTDAPPPTTDAPPTQQQIEAVALGQSPLIKTISIVGGDAAEIEGLQVREQLLPSQVRVTVGGTDRQGSGTTRLDLEGTSVTYQLQLSEGASFGPTATTQQTELVVGDTVLGSTVEYLLLDAPQVDVTLDTLSDVSGGDSADISVKVTNSDDQAVLGAHVLTVQFSEGSNLVTVIDLGDGEQAGDAVSWNLPRGLDPGQVETRAIRVSFGTPESESKVTWRAELTKEGAEDPLAVGSGTTVIAMPSDPDGPTGVRFSPSQLIQLIAFVMAFALVAVIFGHWIRRSDEDSSHDLAKSRAAELNRFRAYTQAILVLVILVAILVLALNGSLSGESAGSLIGVIAGYALGNVRSGGGGDG